MRRVENLLGETDANPVMKAFVVAVYREFDTSMIGDSMPEQVDGLIATPIGNKVMVQFHELAIDEKGKRTEHE